MTGCSSTTVQYNPPKIPEAFLEPCPPFVKAEGSSPKEILKTHAENMSAARICKVRHNTLIEVVRTRINNIEEVNDD